jgi:acyl-CoA thioesterase
MTYREATAVRRVEENLWQTQFAENWDIMGFTNGGYMQAIASRASSEAVGGRHPVSITGHFTRPGHTGPAQVETEVIRHGKRFSVVRSRMTQDGEVVLVTLGSFSEPREEDPEILLGDAAPPDLPPPDQCERALPAGDVPFPPPFVGQVDMRVGPTLVGTFAGKPSGQALIDGWIRPKDDEASDPHFLVVVSDAFPPTTFNAGLLIGWTPTLELTVHIRFPEAVGWIRCEFKSRFVSGGLIEEDGLFWDDKDRLIAQSRQLALVAK